MRTLRTLACLLSLTACTLQGAPPVPPEQQFVPLKPIKSGQESERALALRVAFNDCRAKSLVQASQFQNEAVPQQTITNNTSVTVNTNTDPKPFLDGIQPYNDPNWGERLRNARMQKEMESAIFETCMNKAGFIRN
jgi:hypothetical protein